MKKHTAYCGIDVGLKTHSICLLDDSQHELTHYVITNDIHGFTRLAGDLDKDTKICLEPTGVYSLNIFLYLRNKGHDVRFCKTKSAHDFREAMYRNKKHDRLDARALAKYRVVNEDQTFDGKTIMERLGSNDYSSSKEYQRLVELIDSYLFIKRRTQKLHNRIKGIIDLRFPEAIQIFPSNRGCKTILAALLHPKEDILAGKIKLNRLKEIQEKLSQSIGQYEMKQDDFRKYAEELQELEKKADETEKLLKEHLHAMGYGFLFSYYCLNTVGIAVLIREIRDIQRFYRYNDNGQLNKKKSLRAFRKFLGLDVTSNQSGTKEGGHAFVGSNTSLKNILFLMAMRYVQIKPEQFDGNEIDLNPVRFKALYEQYVGRGKKKLIALTKIMSKIATDLFFILRDNADSEASHTLNQAV